MRLRLRSRRFTLCADDFGQSEAINRAIIELVRVWRLGATSVLSDGPAWPEGARVLRDLAHMADIGLHLNLTHPFDGVSGTRPLLWWMAAAPRGMVKVDAVRAAFSRQIDAFVKHFGRLPDYIDGHQHVHAFPQIREVVTDLIAEVWTGDAKPWVRAPDRLVDSGGVPLKGWVLKRLARGFSEHLAREGLVFPSRFGGLYSLQPDARYPRLMRRWLHGLPSGTLLMCHPGHESFSLSDPIREARFEEFLYLSGVALPADCQAADASLVRFSDLESDAVSAEYPLPVA